MGANVVGITYYPVKGCAGVTLTEATVTPAGLLHDRAFAVTDEKGDFRWQGADPRLALIAPELRDGELTLRAPGSEPLKVGGDGACPGADAWLTEVLGRPSRLVRPPAGNHARLHVVSRASLDALNRRIAERGARTLPMNRFRPNLVIDGWTAPHTEDDTSRLTIAGTALAFTERTVRCAITMVDQETGRRAGPEPLRTLAGYRRTPEGGGGVVFGAYFAVLRPGRIAVGDEVSTGE
ncbi:MOSC domain-containing protein [Streptomyces sp. NPDC049687]|uniref:MOSC domain-containing protein n=1 Tax=Streptomyces sp. NPDC049687 TaxID=3365596 RepID=UPI0037BA6382